MGKAALSSSQYYQGAANIHYHGEDSTLVLPSSGCLCGHSSWWMSPKLTRPGLVRVPSFKSETVFHSLKPNWARARQHTSQEGFSKHCKEQLPTSPIWRGWDLGGRSEGRPGLQMRTQLEFKKERHKHSRERKGSTLLVLILWEYFAKSLLDTLILWIPSLHFCHKNVIMSTMTSLSGCISWEGRWGVRQEERKMDGHKAPCVSGTHTPVSFTCPRWSTPHQSGH